MRRRLAVVLVAVLLSLGGIGAAYALTASTSVLSVCATASTSTPVQTISANGTQVGKIAAKTAIVTACTTTTVTVPTTTVTSTVPVTTTVFSTTTVTVPASTTTPTTTTIPPLPPPPLGTSLPARLAQSSGTASVYVSPSGSDSNPGTLAAPVQSLDQALALAPDGANVYLRGGNYGWQYVFHHIYSAANPVTIQSYPGERATFVGNSDHTTNAVTFDDIAGLRIQDVTFQATQNTTALKFTDPAHVEVNNVVIRDTDSGCNDQGVSVPSGSVPACGWGIGLAVIGQPLSGWTNQIASDFQLWNSTFTNNGAHSKGQGGAINHAHAMLLCGGGTTGPQDNGCDGLVVANNVVYDSPTGIAVRLGDAAHNGFVVNNTIDNTDTRAATTTALCTTFTGNAVTLWGDYAWPDRNVLIANNIISNNCANAVIATGFTGGGDVIRNNLGFDNGYACDWTPDCTTEYNCVWGASSICTVGANLAAADPLYVNRSGAFGASGKDFHLKAGSPALGQSDPAYTPPLDKDGNARAATPAVGAYERDSPTTPPFTTTSEGWTNVIDSEFAADGALPAPWRAYDFANSNPAGGYYLASHVVVSGGILALVQKYETSGPARSASFSDVGGGWYQGTIFAEGGASDSVEHRVTTRLRIVSNGVSSHRNLPLWWPNSGDSTGSNIPDGEEDYFESDGLSWPATSLGEQPRSFFHYGWDNSFVYDVWDRIDLTQWHIFRFQRRDHKVTIWIDDMTTPVWAQQYSVTELPDTIKHIVFQQENPDYQPPAGATGSEEIQIDWIKVDIPAVG